MITLSLNEIDAAVKRAARGVGLSWGLAEEAGKAARMLASGGLCGLDLVLRALRHDEHGDPGTSPFRLGPALCDGVLPPGPDGSVLTGAVRDPGILLGYAALMAKAAGNPLTVTWPGCDVMVGGGAADIRTAGALTIERAEAVRLAAAPGAVLGRTEARCATDEATWSALVALGHRTFVPPSAHSRAKGAGSGLSDND